MPPSPDLAPHIAAVRRFTRFYTNRTGVLREVLLDGPFSLSEARILYELAQCKAATAAKLATRLSIDAGYLSRILKSFEERGFISRAPSPKDARRIVATLTQTGRDAFAALDAGAQRECAGLLEPLAPADRKRLVEAMQTIETLMAETPPRKTAYLLRPHRPGDMGWVAQRHGALYAEEYGWDQRFEALVARIAADFIDRFDSKRDKCWIAEKDGERIGSAFVVKRAEDQAAQLRMLLVEPAARGSGLGMTLVEECLTFAKQAGYKKMILWTNANLTAARRIYEKTAFRLVASEPHRSFGKDLIGETWEKDL